MGRLVFYAVSRSFRSMKIRQKFQNETFHGFSWGHHGEILQGIFRTDAGKYVRALVSLSCRSFSSRACFQPIVGSTSIEAAPDKSKAVRAAELTLRHLGVSGGGILNFVAEIPSGFGYGSSSADVLATIEAVAASAGVSMERAEVSALAVAAEGASDPLHWGNRAVLWAQREGAVVEDFGMELPPLTVLGFDLGDSIDTLGMPLPMYNEEEIAEFEELRQRLRMALPGNVVEIAGIATASAIINNRYFPKPHFERLLELCSEMGLPGLQVAHSGSAVGLFVPASYRGDQLVKQIGVELERLGVSRWGLFSNER